MIKAFISHSSKQKAFALELVESLGRDYCGIDCFDLQPAYKTIDEIYRVIEESTVFVLLVSRDSLNSDWVQKEIRYAKTKLQPNEMNRFWPYLIDSSITLNDCPDWMAKDECFNLKQFKSPYVLARDIEQKFRRIIWSNNSRVRMLETMMVGRNSDIAKFEDKFQSINGINLKALIISGRHGVGKDTFAKQCMNKVGFPAETEPYRISTKPHENVENFIVYLNMILRHFTDTELQSVLSLQPKEKAHEAVLLLNELYETRTVLFVNDNLSCLLPNKNLAEWMIDILNDSKLNNQLGLFIMTQKIPNAFVESKHPQVAHIQLQPLDKKDRRKLFVNCIRAYGLEGITQEDIDFFVDKLLQSPSQIIQVAEALSNNTPMPLVKRDVASIIAQGDISIKPILERFNEDEQRYLLIIMSRMDFISYELLEAIFEERIIETMETIYDMMEYGIVTSFGPSSQFFRLDHYVSDYIRRCHFAMPQDWESSVEEVFEKSIASSNSITEDTSLYLYKLKQQIMTGKGNNTDYLIPSVVVTSVMDVYNDKNYPLVVTICDNVLNGVHTYYEDMLHELRYWLCLALCRLQNNRFFDEVKIMQGADYYFLRGFYYRIAEKYSDAEKCYKKVLSYAPNMQRAKRELVTTLLAQNQFETALSMAKENYEHDPDNSYQIQGYFRCLVRKRQITREDFNTLNVLLEAMKNNYSDKHEELYAAMNIEYQAYISHKKPSEIFDLIKEASERFPDSVNIERAAYNYRFKQEMINTEKSFAED